MSTENTRTLRDLHDQIRTAALDLAEPARRPLLRDDGTTTIHPADALLTQLAAEITPGGDHNGTGRGATGVPVALDVLDLQRRITAESAAWCWNLTGQAPPEALAERVRTIARAAGQLIEVEQVARIARFLADWVTSIRTVLEPPRKMALAEPCPACGARVHYHRDDAGEVVRRHPLEVDGHRGCTCLTCGTHWPVDQLEHLALVIGCTPVGA